jgi:hypothetical protein
MPVKLYVALVAPLMLVQVPAVADCHWNDMPTVALYPELVRVMAVVAPAEDTDDEIVPGAGKPVQAAALIPDTLTQALPAVLPPERVMQPLYGPVPEGAAKTA